MYKKILIIIILSLIFTYLPTNFVKASVNFSGIEVYDMINGNAKLKWGTNLDTRAEIWYGLDQNNLDRFMGYSVYDRWHETVLTGLEREKTYYYKIKAIEESGETTETFVRNFSTDDMEDTIKPDFEEARFLQTTHTAVALRWITDEKTKATIYYGTDPDNLTKKSYYRSYYNLHTQLIYDLNSGEKYYFKIKAIDEDGNYKEKVISTTTHDSGTISLNISNIEPTSSNSDLIGAETATIKWKTNLIAKGVIYYGTSPKKLNKRIYVSSHKLREHEAVLSDLIPDKTYYFEIKAYKSLYNKSKTSNIMSFKTKSIEEAYSENYPIGTLVKGSDPKVYVLREGMEKIWIKNEETFNSLGYRWSMIKNVSDEYLNAHETTIEQDRTRRHPTGTLIKYEGDSTVYMVYYNTKRPFFTAYALERRGYSWDDIITVPDSREYETGDELF
jgi:hypothetical protein